MGGPHREPLIALAPWLADYPVPEAGASAYVCEGFACRAPVETAEALREALGLTTRKA